MDFWAEQAQAEPFGLMGGDGNDHQNMIDLDSFLHSEDTINILDQVNQALDDEDIFFEQPIPLLQPTPIGSNGSIKIVPELPAHVDSSLCNSSLANDFLALLSSNDNNNCSNSNSSYDNNNNNNKKRTYGEFSDCMSKPFCPEIKKQKTATFFSVFDEKSDDGNDFSSLDQWNFLMKDLEPKKSQSSSNAEDVHDDDAVVAVVEGKLLPATTATTTLNDIATFDNHSAIPSLPVAAMESSPGHHREQWNLRYEMLLEYKAANGHCSVPNVFPENPQLAQWVKRQRHQYKLKIEGKHSTLTDDREEILEQVGFIWDSHEAAWMERWEELKTFREEHGHSNVPTNYDLNRPLSVWVKCQRRQYKLYKSGKASNMTENRIAKMESLDFNWNPRNLKY